MRKKVIRVRRGTNVDTVIKGLLAKGCSIKHIVTTTEVSKRRRPHGNTSVRTVTLVSYREPEKNPWR